MNRATNVADNANQQIFDFVQQPANRRLISGTGAYSTPFLGSLFGLSESDAVARKLKTRRIDALWLGSNSCHHLADPVAYRRDRRKDQLLQENGYLVLRYLAEDLARELDAVLDGILRSLHSRRKQHVMAAPMTLVRRSSA